jgi:chlorobactene glucosyltransferase
MATGTDFLLLLLSITVINISWIAIFILSIRTYYLIPAIDRGLKITRMQAMNFSSSSSSSSSSQSVEGINGPSYSCGYLPNILTPFLSIIVPARNEEKNIKRCLLSLLNQNYPNFELIAIDDNSTDNTLPIMNQIKKNASDRLKVISLSSRPDGWTGKGWASHQGYLHAQGKILLFTDADTCFFNKDTIIYAISYLQSKNIDVLTGHARIELSDFWSKITIPLWDFFSIILDKNPAAVNNTRSNAAYLVGSFFMIRRRVLKHLGGFRTVRGAIKEDVELGLQIKKAGFKIKIAKLDKFYSALWSRDFLSLWHGIGRTFFPMSKFRVIANLLSLFFLAMTPFLIFTYTVSSFITQNHLLPSVIILLNLSACIMIIIGTAIKNIKKYNISAIYSFLTFPAALFLITAYVTNIFLLFISSNGSKRIRWRDRTYLYNKRGDLRELE